ncbi:MAG TPA: aldo/keto reductase, partial [Isosphaeraceae bacterium]|nr:aldo/keto reductase [Isosphaeraceae bacterium]
MRYLSLGPTGVLVSELCLGTMTFGEGWGLGGIDRAAADAIVGRALEAGINFIDTADVYSEGNSEQLLGQVLDRSRRDRVVLAT